MKKIYLLAGLLLLASPLFAQRTLIHCGNLFDGTGTSLQPQMTVVVEGNKITAVQKGYTPASGQDKVLDMKSKTVLPGLIDMHVHLESQTRRGGAIDGFTKNPADVAYQAAQYAKTTLMAGLRPFVTWAVPGSTYRCGMPSMPGSWMGPVS